MFNKLTVYFLKNIKKNLTQEIVHCKIGEACSNVKTTNQPTH